MKADWANRLLELDAFWSRRLQIASQPGFLRNLEAFLSHSGDSLFVMLAVGIAWWLGNADWKSLAITLAIGVGVTALAVLLVKLAVRRPRPEGEWGQLYRKTDPHSFPSGHAARVFMLAVVTIGLGPPWLGILLALWALLVGLSRIIMGVHYLSDVLAGALLGVVIGLGIVWLA